MKNYQVLSLFDGVSGLQQAFKNLGIEFDGRNNIYYASEIDKYAIQVTQKNFPNTVQLGDVKKITFDNYIDEEFKILCVEGRDMIAIPDEFERGIDLLSFGFPCQDISISKKNRQGLQGERSGLFYEALRILKEVKPKFFLAENVASMSKEVKEEITKELFGIEPVMINSALLTAQTRKRFYWIGKLQEDGTYKKVEITQPEDRGIFLKDILESGVTYQDKSYALTASYDGAVFWNTLQKKQRTMVLEPIRLGHFNKGGQADRIYSIEGKSVCLSANGGGGGALTGLYAFPADKIDFKTDKNIYKVENGLIYNCMEREIGKVCLEDGYYLVRKLTPIECERLQGFPDDFFYIGENLIVSKRQCYRGLGNSFTVPVIEHILKDFNIILKAQATEDNVNKINELKRRDII